jgi:hypothetical protein
MYKNDQTGGLKLISEQHGEAREFYCSAHTAVDIRFKDKTELRLNSGEFIDIEKHGKGHPTHKKFFIQERFTKI